MGVSKHVFLVVLYKMTLVNSPTIQSINRYFQNLEEQAASRYTLMIWDNSPTSSQDDVQMLQNRLPLLNIEYIHSIENVSLSKIYNEVACRVSVDEYLTLFDQDTSLPAAYFEELSAAQQNKWNLILPKVQCQGVLVSPGKRFIAHGRLLKGIKAGMVNSKNLLAINSGMTVLGKVFTFFKYDERLRFYGTDTYFMKQYEKYFENAFILDTPVLHSLSEMEMNSNDWWAAHTEERLRTFGIIFSDSFTEAAFVRLYTLVIKIKNSFINRPNRH